MKTLKLLFPLLTLLVVLLIPFNILSQDFSKIKNPPPEISNKFGSVISNPDLKKTKATRFIKLISCEVDEITAKKAAMSFSESLNKHSGLKSMPELKMVYKATSQNSVKKTGKKEKLENPYFYIFSSDSDKIYLIVAGDKRSKPILAYSTTSAFDQDNIPPNLSNWLRVYEKQIQYARDHNLPGEATTQSDWQSLLKNEQLITEPMMDPLIQTWWGQSPYYNDFCPIIPSEGKKALAGCMATAMGQLMKYWEYPEKGTGTHAYIPESHPELGIISANFEEKLYKWDDMPDSINSPNEEIARLIFHCGVSTNMDYGANVSWASLKEYNHPCAHLAFPNFFGYKQKCLFIRKSEYSHEDWMVRIIEELLSERPVLYSGGGEDLKNAGHIFICDGYDNQLNLHFNWGWKGVADGYFSTYAINFLDFFDYTDHQLALIEIEPLTKNPEADVRTCSKPKVSPSNYLTQNDTINVKVNFKNFGLKPIAGKFIATFWNMDGYLVGGSIQPQVRELKPGMSTGEMSFTSEVNSNMIPGNYMVYFAIQTPQDSTIYIGSSWSDSMVFNSSFRFHILGDHESIPADEYENNDSEEFAYELIPDFKSNKASLQLTPNIHHVDDIDYYKIILSHGENYTISSLMTDYQTNLSYIFDGKYSSRIGKSSNEWCTPEDVDIPDFKVGTNDSIVYFKVEPFLKGNIGYYALNIDILKDIQDPSGITSDSENSLKLYPNPTQGSLILDLSLERLGESELCIYSIEGIKVYSKKLKSQADTRLELPHELPSGLYLVQISNKNHSIIKKLLIQR